MDTKKPPPDRERLLQRGVECRDRFSGLSRSVRFDEGIDPLDHRHRSGVRAALAEFDDAAVTALAGGTRRGDLLEEGLHAALGQLVAPEQSDGTATAVEVVFLAEGNQRFGERAEGLGLRECRRDLAVLDQAGREVAQEGVAVRLVALEFDGFTSMSHRKSEVGEGISRGCSGRSERQGPDLRASDHHPGERR